MDSSEPLLTFRNERRTWYWNQLFQQSAVGELGDGVVDVGKVGPEAKDGTWGSATFVIGCASSRHHSNIDEVGPAGRDVALKLAEMAARQRRISPEREPKPQTYIPSARNDFGKLAHWLLQFSRLRNLITKIAIRDKEYSLESLNQSQKGMHTEEDLSARTSVQEQGCMGNPQATYNSTQELMMHNNGIQGNLETFLNCLHVALQETDDQDKEESNVDGHQREFSMLVLIHSMRIIQLCPHTPRQEYSAHFVQLLQNAMRSLNYLNERRRRVWNDPYPSMN
ncbi:uncharacterized protein LOC132206162 [Stegostoma tigrinum]|uniref:uncharacterized protein LOC132206162 n=1 Tax=Stegostoma tigrinum TaxID=3053191 RepID=UPI00286FD5BE|nr:uncharacterized protein LOC132206162 [Stegostoma tigrinum]